MKLAHCIPLIAPPIGLVFGQLSIFEGNPGLPGNVVQLSSPELRPAELQGVELLPLDFVARTQLDEIAHDRPQRRADIPGAARLLLPKERGSLYKFRRPEAGRASFGFFRIGADGEARFLIELAGTGAAGVADPFPEKLTLSPETGTFLIASHPAAGGNLLEVDLGGSGAVDRTPHLPPIDFARSGLALLDTWGVGVASDGVYRFQRVPGGRAESVDLPISPRWLGPDVVWSEDLSTVAFLAGEDETQALIWTCRRLGPAEQASERPMHVPSAGFLPESSSGPALALSTDGSWVAWRAEDSSRECFARPTIGPRSTDLLLTGPAHFDNTLNDTGVIAFFDRDSIVMVAGREASDGIDRADLYRIDLSSQGPSVTNLTLTSGVVRPPFDYGTLRTSEGLVRWNPAGATTGSAFLAYDRGGRRVLWAASTGGVSSVLDRVASLDSVTVVGSHLVAAVTRPPGVDDPLEESLNLVQIPAGGANPVVVRLPSGCHLSREARSSGHGVYTAVLEFPLGERLGRLRVPSSSGVALPPGLFTYGPAVGVALDGRTLATARVGLEVATFAWSDLVSTVFRLGRTESFLLPGL